jgi:hypothetical protein
MAVTERERYDIGEHPVFDHQQCSSRATKPLGLGRHVVRRLNRMLLDRPLNDGTS